MKPASPIFLSKVPAAVKARRRQWLAALESGKFKQGFGGFHPSNNTYCALGVASHLLKVHNYISIAKQLGLTIPGADTIIIMNDTKRLPFKTIAKRLRAALTKETT